MNTDTMPSVCTSDMISLILSITCKVNIATSVSQIKELGLREVWGLAGQVGSWRIGSGTYALFPLSMWKSSGKSHLENL